jgi:hypothetical protein
MVDLRDLKIQIFSGFVEAFNSLEDLFQQHGNQPAPIPIPTNTDDKSSMFIFNAGIGKYESC